MPASPTPATPAPATVSSLPAQSAVQSRPPPLPSEQSPTWLLERPANAARRRRLNRAVCCQRVLGFTQ
eukprot:4756862-Pleurochrysis_carterae.AAC.1